MGLDKNPRLTPKDMQLLKGAIRRVFARSELRKKVLDANTVEHHEDLRPRVRKWGFCSVCGLVVPKYTLQVDHIQPLQPIGVELKDMTMDDLVSRSWCPEHNLQVICKPCHLNKSKIENAERRRLKKEKLSNEQRN